MIKLNLYRVVDRKNMVSRLLCLNVSKFLLFSIILFTFHSSLFTITSAQTVYEPVNKDVYQFLEWLNTKGILEFDNLILPLSREYIVEKLFTASENKKKLTSLEREELKFYFQEYGYEIEKVERQNANLSAVEESKTEKADVELLKDNEAFVYQGMKSTAEGKSNKYSLLEKDRFGRFRVFGYVDKNVNLVLDPILGLEYTSGDGKSSTHIWNGVSLYGSYGDHIGFSMDFRDNTLSGELFDTVNSFSSEQGRSIKSGEGNTYNITNAMLSYKWNWGSVSIGKTPFEWGYVESGKIVHSSKAPSYPNIRLDLKLTSWLSFNYLHGWLNSEIIDSNEIYESLRNDAQFKRELFREKYFATHSLNIKPLKGLSFAIGESIIYSDRLELSYLVPVMFFRLADHYKSSFNNDAGNNAQFFFSLSSRNHIPKTHLFASLFIDEIKTGEIFDAKNSKNQLAYTFGLNLVDLPLKNSSIKFEYSHINPFAYKHYIETQLYSNQGYNLGHWIGHNGDIVHLSYTQRYIRGLFSKIWAQFIRKGEEGNADVMYTTPQPAFLFGLNTNYTYYGIDLKYELIHDLNIRAKYQYSSIESEYEEGKFANESHSTFKFALYYGL